jgi:hypothetical protein
MSDWVGGTGDFTDPDFWSDGPSAPPPNPPPVPEFPADYLNSGDVLFSGNTNTYADINADITFDLSGGGYTLTTFGLLFDQGLVNASQHSFALTLTGANTLSTPNIQVDDGAPVSLTITQGATLDALNQGGNPVEFASDGALVVTDGGQLLLNDGALNTGVNDSQQNLDVDDGTIVASGLSLTEVSVAVLDGSALTATAGSITLTDQGTADILTISDSALTASDGAISVSGTNVAIGGTNTFTGAAGVNLSAAQTLTVSGVQNLASSDPFLGSGGGNELLSQGTVVITAGAVVAASLGLLIGAPFMTIAAGASISASDSLLVTGGQMIASDAMITVGGTAEFAFGTADGVTLDSGTTMQAAAMLLETALTVTGATTMLGVTNLLMLDVVGAALDVAAGAAVSTGTFDVGMGTAVVEGAGSLLQVNGDAAIGFATSGASLTINCGGNATVAGDLMVGTSAGTGGSVTLDGSGTTLSVGGTVSVAAAQPTCIRSSAGRLVGTSARRSVCAQTAPA